MARKRKHNWRITNTEARRQATRKWRREYKIMLATRIYNPDMDPDSRLGIERGWENYGG